MTLALAASVAECQLVIRGSTAIQRPMDSIAANSPVEAIYDAEGTGAGQEAAVNGTADIGTGDVPLPADLFTDGIVHVPTMIGGISFGFNIDGIEELKLTACNLAAIYMRTVDNWGDSSFVDNNPALDNVDIDIVPVARSDSSGSTAVVTQYFMEACSRWTLGAGKVVDWPKGVVAVDETSRVVETVVSTNGAIGYAAIGRFGVDVEAQIEAADGLFDTTEGAEFGNVGDKDLPGPTEDWSEVEFIFEEGGYPTSFVGFFYVPVNTSPEVVDFIKFVLSNQVQDSLPDYGFRAMPRNLRDAAQAAVDVLEGKK